MCLNKRYITNSNGQQILVKCGHCPACLQEKAFNRTQRIKNNMAVGDGLVCLFCGFTYDNKYIPYIRKSEFYESEVYIADSSLTGFDAGDLVRDVVVYRDYGLRCVRCPDKDGKRQYEFASFPVGYLDTFTIPFTNLHDDFKPLKNGDPDKIGVIYYKDIQDFEKRLRINLKRKYNYDKYFRFFNCAEYGPTSCRPHIHGLFFVPEEDVELFKLAINEAWPYDCGNAERKKIQIARNAAAYVSSYVNCYSSIPVSFQTSKFRPKHSYSKGFGMGKESFSFPKVLEAIRNRDLTYDKEVSRNGATELVRMLLPKYVINRFFPKIKGFSRLSSNEIKYVCERPERLKAFIKRLDYDEQDIRINTVCLRNKLHFASSYGLTPLQYALAYADVWTIWSSNVMREFYKSQESPEKIFYAYDNIIDFFDYKVSSPSLDLLYDVHLPSNLQSDFNLFPANVAKDLKLRQMFDNYQKYSKTANYVYSQKYYL